ncbi:MAG: ammonia monooxygenase [Nitrosopumilus sp.]|nr:ammonia monooxygenase [Nitrosopumilus sp.]MDH3824147.1 ammonia monooxygenase [Nitrosopumilus sp.]MDH3834667.1 ammonia monooxygenase [Nitrosopumilus sp.]
MVWLRRCTHYLFIVVVAVNSTLLTINAGDYIFYTDWAWTSFTVFSISQTLMLAVGATYYLTFTGVPGTATYYGLIMTVYTWIAKAAWFSLGYPYDFIVTPVWLPSAMLLDLVYWATKKNKHSLILFGGVLVGMSIPLFNMVNLITVADPLETAFKYPRPTLPPYMTPIEPQVGKFYNSPVALGAGAGAVLSVTFTALGCKLNTWTYRWMAAWSKWD